MAELEYDLVALGGGTAGLVSAAGARYIGATSAIVEREALGGDCLWTGCVPSKALIASARLAHAMRDADRLGLTGAAPKHAFAEVMARLRDARSTVAHHDDPERFRGMGVDVHLGAGRFVEPGLMEVDGIGRIRSKRFVVATGAVPWIPPIPGLEEAGYQTHATIFETDTLPARLVVLGGGPIGLELAQSFARLGSAVTVVEMADEVLPKEDPVVASLLRALLEAEGIAFTLGARASRVTTDDGAKVLHTGDGARFPADEILVATGRRPATGALGLDAVGVETDDGAVRVDDTLATTGDGVWAAGDVTGGLQFTHVADYMAKKVIRNALIPGASSVDYAAIPRVTYTDPEVAHVGPSREEEVEATGGSSWRYDLDDLDRAICDASTTGFVELHADRRGRVLGGTVMAHGAGELLMPVVLATRHGLSLGDLTETVFPYPTMSEGVLRAAQAWRRTQIESTGGRILRKVVGWLA